MPKLHYQIIKILNRKLVFRFNLYTSNHRARRGGEREMTPSERRSEILHLLCKRRHETAINLSAELGVSERTIRADLVILSCYYPIQVVRGRLVEGSICQTGFTWRAAHYPLSNKYY